jgi:hypothetical protein
VTTAADVPNKYDLVISDGTNTYGYVLYAPWTGGDSQNAPQLAIHSYSPTFVPRQNVQGNYGDDSEDFFMTLSQKDWSLGENLKYQGRTDDARRRYWRGSQANIFIPGEVTIQDQIASLSFASSIGSPTTCCYRATSNTVVFATGTNLYSVDNTGTVTDNGAHGLGDTPALWGSACDGKNVYITTEDASTVGVRQWTGSAFSTFSATASSALEYLNNSLFGLDKDGIFRVYSTAGVASTIYTFRYAEGTALSLGTYGRLKAFGGQMLILLRQAGPQVPELWIYDGVGVRKIAEFPGNFFPYDIQVVAGSVFLGGYFSRGSAYKPAIFYYANGTIGKLWEAEQYSGVSASLPMTNSDQKLIFNDPYSQRIIAYNPETGGVSSLTPYSTVSGEEGLLAAAQDFFVITQKSSQSAQTPQFVQLNGAPASGHATTKKIAWGIPTTQGSLLLMCVHIWDKDGTVPTPTTPTGWTLVDSVVHSSNDYASYLYKIENADSRSGTETITLNDSVNAQIDMAEISGAFLEDETDTNSGTGTTADSGTTSTTGNNNEIWLAFFANFGNEVSIDDAASFDLSSITNSFGVHLVNGSRPIVSAIASKVVSSTGTANTSIDITESEPWTGIVATFESKTIGSGFYFPSGDTATGATITSPLFDFDSSQDKLFRGIKIDYDEADDGDGGSVDISYQIDDLTDSSYTLLQSSAVSGTEYAVGDVGSQIVGRSISIRIALNKGTSTDGPKLKRIYVRAAPIINQKRRDLYHIDATGSQHGKNATLDHTNAAIARSGQIIFNELKSFAGSGSLLTITDVDGDSYTGVIESLEGTQVHANDDPGYVISLVTREV